MNEFSVRHQQDLIVSSLEHKSLTEPTFLKSFDFRFDSNETGNGEDTVSATLKVTDSGIGHAFIYWYIFGFSV